MAPLPQVNVSVREATLADVPFIDALQKLHSKQLGFMRTSWLEEKIGAGQVIIAEESSADFTDCADEGRVNLRPSAQSADRRLGYIVSQDKYLKREELGLVVQLCVVPGRQRGFVGATLLKAAFERAAYGCRLFCCWCAQDLEANRFWAAMGFVPLAYRAGSEKKRRVHIFWQKRIRAGDEGPGATPWWFPSQTNAGAIRADRIVLPIPPGVRWEEEMPVVVLPTEGTKALRHEGTEGKAVPRRSLRASVPSSLRASPVLTTASIGMRFGPPPPPVGEKVEKPKPVKRSKVKNDPKLVAAARELRDRWLEQVNAGQYVLEDAAKYDVARIAHADAPSALTLPSPRGKRKLLPSAA